jgi:hypothetical protein
LSRMSSEDPLLILNTSNRPLNVFYHKRRGRGNLSLSPDRSSSSV